ncbi:hypothetical protein EDC01DRAFT_460889 [Geopyxis carbonaria]|nr:hypothetical protein EDC01DRAFT_460889 [Geopyxis carbonaria]
MVTATTTALASVNLRASWARAGCKFQVTGVRVVWVSASTKYQLLPRKTLIYPWQQALRSTTDIHIKKRLAGRDAANSRISTQPGGVNKSSTPPRCVNVSKALPPRVTRGGCITAPPPPNAAAGYQAPAVPARNSRCRDSRATMHIDVTIFACPASTSPASQSVNQMRRHPAPVSRDHSAGFSGVRR